MSSSTFDEFLAGQESGIELLIEQLVNQSSHTADTSGTGEVALIFQAAMAELCGPQLISSLHLSPSGNYGHHISFVTEAGKNPGAVVLIGHHDTVFPTRVFQPFRRDAEKLYGSGVLDMKGGLAVIAYALAALAHAGWLEKIPVRVVSVSDEEVGSPEGSHLVREACQGATAALVFESGRTADRVVTQRKGTGGLTVKAKGRAAHAGNEHQTGRNAIWALSRLVDWAQQQTNYDTGFTVNVGRIEGGIGKNTVPDAAQLLVDFRFVDPMQADRFLDALGQIKEKISADLEVQFTIEGGVMRAPLVRTTASAALAEAYGRACARSGLDYGEAPLLGGGSDANTASAAGVPAIDALGPRGRGMHTQEEFVERASLIPKAKALAYFLADRFQLLD